MFWNHSTPLLGPLRSLATMSTLPSPFMSRATSDITHPAPYHRLHEALPPGVVGNLHEPIAAKSFFDPATRSIEPFPSTSMGSAYIHWPLPCERDTAWVVQPSAFK